MFDIRGHSEVLKVKVTVILVSKSVIGAEHRTFMTHRANQHFMN